MLVQLLTISQYLLSERFWLTIVVRLCCLDKRFATEHKTSTLSPIFQVTIFFRCFLFENLPFQNLSKISMLQYADRRYIDFHLFPPRLIEFDYTLIMLLWWISKKMQIFQSAGANFLHFACLRKIEIFNALVVKYINFLKFSFH